MTPATPPAIPQMLAEHFAQAFAAFVDALRAAVNETAQNPALSNSRALLLWQTQALPQLEKKNDSVQKAMALFLVGEERSIVEAASDARHIDKELDGFDLNFAGEERGRNLDQLETMVTVTAYQVCAAAGVP